MTCEDFEHTNVVTKTSKRLAWFCVIVLNIYFVYFSVLRGISRSVSWQRDYVLACVFQLLVEVFLYETVECLWIHYTIPKLVSHEVAATMKTVRHSVDMAFQKENEVLHLDSPKYFFVSRQLADAYPQLFESSVVRAFHSHFPPSNLDLKMWPKEGRKGRRKERKKAFPITEWDLEDEVPVKELPKKDSGLLSFVRRFSVSALAFVVLQMIGTVPIRFQQLVIHTLQPILFSFVIILYLIIEEHPATALIPMAVIVYESLVYANKSRNKVEKPISAINDTEKIIRIRKMLKDKQNEESTKNNDNVDQTADQFVEIVDSDDDVIENYSTINQSTVGSALPQFRSNERDISSRHGYIRQQTAEELIREMADSDDDDEYVPVQENNHDRGSNALRSDGNRAWFNRQQTAEELIREMADSDSEANVSKLDYDNESDVDSDNDGLLRGEVNEQLVRLADDVSKLKQEVKLACLETGFMAWDDIFFNSGSEAVTLNAYNASTDFTSSCRLSDPLADSRTKWQRWWDDYRLCESNLILPHRNNNGIKVPMHEIESARAHRKEKSTKKFPKTLTHKLALLQLAEHSQFTYMERLLLREGGAEILARHNVFLARKKTHLEPQIGGIGASRSINEVSLENESGLPYRPWKHEKDDPNEIRLADEVYL